MRCLRICEVETIDNNKGDSHEYVIIYSFAGGWWVFALQVLRQAKSGKRAKGVCGNRRNTSFTLSFPWSGPYNSGAFVAHTAAVIELYKG